MARAGCYTEGLKSMKDLRIYGCRQPKPEARAGAALAAVAFFLLALASPALVPPAAAQTGAAAIQRIGPGDVVQVEVVGRQDLSGTGAVDEQGGLSLPTIGVIRAAGRTAAELSADISRRISLTQRDAPQVRVTILEVRSRKIFVLGGVLLPGPYSFRKEPTVWEAISEAGGPSEDANLAAVEVIPDDATGARKKTIVDVGAAVRSGALETLPRVKPGDTVQVPRSGIGSVTGDGGVVYVMGAVATQGAHGLATPNDLISTVIRCSPTADADLAKVEIVRREGGRVTQMKVNVRDYLSEAQPNGNPVLRSGDTIYVPRESRGFGLFTIIGYVSPVIALATSIALLAR